PVPEPGPDFTASLASRAAPFTQALPVLPSFPPLASTPVPATLSASCLTAEQQVAHDGLAWLAAGNRYEGPTAKLLATEAAQREGRTLILTGYGVGLRVERDALVVTEGRTHHPQTPAVHTLYRGMHGVSRLVCHDPKGSLSFPAV